MNKASRRGVGDDLLGILYSSKSRNNRSLKRKDDDNVIYTIIIAYLTARDLGSHAGLSARTISFTIV